MSKYDPLTAHLAAQPDAAVTMRFGEIDAIVGGLPPSAREQEVWWADDETSRATHTQCRGWLNDNRTVEAVDLGRELVRFSARD